jgi:hypothetical protein
MRFVAFIHADERAWDAPADDELERVYGEYAAFTEEALAAGVIAGGNQLARTDTATTVRVRDGETLVTDGPFAELKEALGGYFVLDCDSIEEACRWAARIPAARRGAVEVRAVYVDEGEAS